MVSYTVLGWHQIREHFVIQPTFVFIRGQRLDCQNSRECKIASGVYPKMFQLQSPTNSYSLSWCSRKKIQPTQIEHNSLKVNTVMLQLRCLYNWSKNKKWKMNSDIIIFQYRIDCFDVYNHCTSIEAYASIIRALWDFLSASHPIRKFNFRCRQKKYYEKYLSN